MWTQSRIDGEFGKASKEATWREGREAGGEEIKRRTDDNMLKGKHKEYWKVSGEREKEGEKGERCNISYRMAGSRHQQLRKARSTF